MDATGWVRHATASDAEAIARIHVQTWRETYDGLLPEAALAARPIAVRQAFWSRILDDPEEGAAVLVAGLSHGPIVGFGSCGPQRDETLAARGFAGEVSALYVLRSRQGLGLGRALLEGMFAQLRLRGLDSASLWVLEANLPARSFYARLGGQVVAEKLDHRVHGVVAEVAYGWQSLTIP